ncbi:receptor-like protein kinase FERONIA [Tanacetum coccineum]|uniref:Receptor-like protein kinase FERONIA n=1 Tax=Tanacetum coccineum TaxID=301880 RepID=A0ABQ5FEK3_9ASTR
MDKGNGETEKLTSSTTAQPSRRFTIAEIQSATNNFDDELVIGQGGFGKVYKGQISIEDYSHFVAIKRLDSMSNQGAAEFKAEIEMLSKLRHCNLVSLIGYCDDNKEMILVYVYMPRGTLYDHLHKVTATPLSWIQRLKIAIGAGRGLDYLHTGFGTQHEVIHRDVKSSNILLDENLAAMISDFGLSKIGPIDQTAYNVSVSVKGTFGYLDPEYFYTSKLTRKTDVYAFGVVLFELLSGKLAVDRDIEGQGSLARWAQKCVKEKRFDQMVDSNITGTIAPKCLRGFAKIANRCLIRDFVKRPSMTQVVAKLQDLLELQKKCGNSADSPVTSGFNWMIRRYRGSATNQNSDHVGKSRSSGANMNHCNPLSTIGDADGLQEMPHQWTTVPTEDLKEFTYDELKYAARGFGYETMLAECVTGRFTKPLVNAVGIGFDILEASEHSQAHRILLRFLMPVSFGPPFIRMPTNLSNLVMLVTKSCCTTSVGYKSENGTRNCKRACFLFNSTQDKSASDDFTAKFWNYNVWKFRTWNDEKIDSYYHSGCRRPKSLYGWSNLASFTLVLAEILIGEPVPGSNAYKNLSLQDFGKHMEILKE